MSVLSYIKIGMLEYGRYCIHNVHGTSHVFNRKFIAIYLSSLSKEGGVVVHAQSCPTLCNPMDCSLQAHLSMKYSRQKYWSGLPFPTLGDLPNPGIEPTFLASPALSGTFFTTVPSYSKSWPLCAALKFFWNKIFLQFTAVMCSITQ